jgi:hypothetical protein
MVSIRLDGLPPYKDKRFSIRNTRHKIHSRFAALRQAAIKAMAGRAPYRGAIGLDLDMHAMKFEKRRSLTDYVGGVMDTLDGSHGVEFTYLPVVYEDDGQVASARSAFHASGGSFYELTIHFLGETPDGEHTPSADAAQPGVPASPPSAQRS